MKQTHINRILDSQTSIARKVYDAVPINDPWNVSRIFGELKRHHSAMDMRRISGCLDSLKAQKLIREIGKGCFIRVVGSAPAARTTIKLVEKPMATERKRRDPMDIITDITTKMHAMVEDMTELAETFEAGVLELVDYVEHNNQDLTEMKELQRLMKKFGSDS